MIELLFLAPAVVLAAILWRKERQLESVLRASELARKEQAAGAARERETLIEVAAADRGALIAAQEQLLQRIQAPEIATIPNRDPEEPQYVAPGDFKGFWEQKERELNGPG